MKGPRHSPAEQSQRRAAELFARSCFEAGVPLDQMQNFIKAALLLQPKQLSFAAACRLCDKMDGPTKVGYGGARGGGKSHVMLAQVCADDSQRFAGLTTLYLRKVKKAAHEHFDEFRKKICVALPNEYLQQRGVMTFPNGSKVLIGHFANDKDVDQYLGREFDLIAVEELTQLSPTKIQDILSCLRTSKEGWRPRMYANWNWGGVSHHYVKNLFYEPYRNGQENATRFIPATVYDNKVLMEVNPDYIRQLESYTGWRRKSWLEGSPDFQAGQFFTTWNEKYHVLKAYDERQIVTWYGGFDYGRTHPTCFLLAGEDAQGRVFVLEEHHLAQATPEEHAEIIHHMLYVRKLKAHDLQSVYAGRDCFNVREDGHTIADSYANLGINLERAEDDRINGFAKILERLGDQDKGINPTLFIHSRCANLITQIPMAQHNERRPEDVEKMDADPETFEGGDDALEALRNLIGSNPGPMLRNITPVKLGNFTPACLVLPGT